MKVWLDNMRDKTDYMTPLESDPVGGDTVKSIEADSEKWGPIETDWSYQNKPTEPHNPDEQSTKESAPWEKHHTQGREALRTELQEAATHSVRASKWADVQTDLPDGLLTDIRTIAEKLRQTVQALSE